MDGDCSSQTTLPAALGPRPAPGYTKHRREAVLIFLCKRLPTNYGVGLICIVAPTQVKSRLSLAA